MTEPPTAPEQSAGAAELAGPGKPAGPEQSAELAGPGESAGPEQSAELAGPGESAGPAKRARGRESVGDMVRSMSLVLVVVVVVVLLTFRSEPHQTVHRVDYSEALKEVRRVAPYDVLAPVGLGARWKATSARNDNEGAAVTWHIGFVTPDARYAAVEQSDGPETAFLSEFVDGATKSGDVTISGVPWQRLAGGRPELRALVLRGGGVTTVVTGSASFTELRTLASALRGP